MKSAVVTLIGPLMVGFFLVALAGCDPCGSCPVEVPTKTATVTPRATPRTTPSRTRIPTPTATSAGPTATATAAPNACLPSSSLSVLISGTNATAYIPEGNWGGGVAAVAVVPIETKSGIGTGSAPTSITTKSVVNSCSSNSATGETVCVANNTDVYLITGTTLESTLTSGATGNGSFSGGSCMNCGVVIDSSINKALITLGLSGSTGPGGYQFLNLAGTPKFDAPVGAGAQTSEDASIDPTLHLVLSPNEQGNYQLLNVTKGTDPTTATLFNNVVTPFPGEFDSAGEDCTTGIALSTIEFTGDLFIADLKQAKFSGGTPGTPGTWTDTASQVVNFPEFDSLSAGTCGIAVAPGTHVAIVTGEFGGNLEGVVELPATSGTGTPSFPDYVAFTVPNNPDGSTFSLGFDPHTVTSYVSPNSGKALGVITNGALNFLAVIDLEGLLKAPRTGHTVNSPLPAGLVTFVQIKPS
jgi:hypothetical protein